MAMAVELGALRPVKYCATERHLSGFQRLKAGIIAMPVTREVLGIIVASNAVNYIDRHRLQRVYLSISAAAADAAPSTPPASSTPPPTAGAADAPPPPLKPTFSMKKGQIVRVDKEKYLDSVEYYAVAHPKFFKGLDYIYEDRGEVLDIRMFEAGEYALISWAGISTSPAWLPTYMLIKADKLSYRRT